MYNIAVFNRKNHPILISQKLKLIEVADESQLLHQLNFIDGVVIHRSEGEDQNKVLELLLSIKRQKYFPIWIREENGDRLIRKVAIELGALSGFDSTSSSDEIVRVIENTLHLIYQKRLVDSGENEKGTEIGLNELNLSIIMPNNTEIRLTQLEYKLVSLLASNRNQAFVYEDIYKHVWPSDNEMNTGHKKYRIANLVFHTRAKLKQHKVNPNVLQTVRSVGYRLNI
ncbi:DNA-binding response regulator [Enterococcus sp. 5H]|uniref:DNA-binding response regulator n=1 Tax=Enterococcus sp. 5H TaxID=1229490 RepID=UPI0023048591|nr:winged helix-turn-helix domain-containing protein [Enterococcus sp. 5H]MDA9471616.1 transcriptional regulator [Enterococcus sp. 5H]